MLSLCYLLVRSNNFKAPCLQELRNKPKRVRMLAEKALQQVDTALQGGPQAGTAGSGKGAAPMQQRSQADADLAMQMLLVTCCSWLR
jgi:hypothetical protein